MTDLRSSNEQLRKAVDAKAAELRELKLRLERKETEAQELWARVWSFVSPPAMQQSEGE